MTDHCLEPGQTCGDCAAAEISFCANKFDANVAQSAATRKTGKKEHGHTYTTTVLGPVILTIYFDNTLSLYITLNTAQLTQLTQLSIFVPNC